MKGKCVGRGGLNFAAIVFLCRTSFANIRRLSKRGDAGESPFFREPLPSSATDAFSIADRSERVGQVSCSSASDEFAICNSGPSDVAARRLSGPIAKGKLLFGGGWASLLGEEPVP